MTWVRGSTLYPTTNSCCNPHTSSGHEDRGPTNCTCYLSWMMPHPSKLILDRTCDKSLSQTKNPFCFTTGRRKPFSAQKVTHLVNVEAWETPPAATQYTVKETIIFTLLAVKNSQDRLRKVLLWSSFPPLMQYVSLSKLNRMHSYSLHYILCFFCSSYRSL